MLEDIKKALRISNIAMDTEVLDLIEAAKMDLVISGINIDKVVDTEMDPLIKRAITLYTKANFGWDNPDTDRLQQSYLMLKQHLCLSGDYNVMV